MLFEHSLSDYTEISLFEFVFSTRIETYEILFNIYLEDLIIEHQLSLKKEKILFKEKSENIFEQLFILLIILNKDYRVINQILQLLKKNHHHHHHHLK
jgi:hypothetical protein